MIYRAIGLMSGSSLDGLDICFAELEESGGHWSYVIKAADCRPYSHQWRTHLTNADQLSARDYWRLHTAYGHYLGEQVNSFVEQNNLYHQVALISSHGHTVFHEPQHRMTAQLGDGAAIAAATGLNVVSDLRNMDVALGGQGAPIVPIGEKLLLGNYSILLNIGGIANISFNPDSAIHDSRLTIHDSFAFDVCPANRVLNLLTNELGFEYDAEGHIAATGALQETLLQQLNALDYYSQPAPKSLANHFGTDTVFPLLKQSGFSIPDLLFTYVEHICTQVQNAFSHFNDFINPLAETEMLVTGGGAFNTYLVRRIQEKLQLSGIRVIIPDKQVVEFKEALVMALIGVLRWREEENVIASVTGASRSSVGGALWLGA